MIEVGHPDLGDLVQVGEIAGGHVLESLNDRRLRQIGRVPGSRGRGDADLGHLAAVGQFAVGHPVVTGDEERAGESVALGVVAGAEGHGVAAVLERQRPLFSIRQSERAEIDQIRWLDDLTVTGSRPRWTGKRRCGEDVSGEETEQQQADGGEMSAVVHGHILSRQCNDEVG
jgi:hypothetical protein